MDVGAHVGSLSNLGLSTAVLRLIPQHRARDEQAALRGLLLGGRVLSVASSIALVGLVLLWCLGERVEAPYAVPAYLGLICIPILTLTDIQDGVARARGLMALGSAAALRAAAAAAHRGPGRGAPLWPSGQCSRCHRRCDRRQLGGRDRADLAVAAPLAAGAPARAAPLCLCALAQDGAAILADVACDLTLQNADVLVISSYLGPENHEPCALYSLCGRQRDGE